MLALAAAFVAPGCVDEQEILIVQQAIPPSDADACTFDSAEETIQFNTVYDVFGGTGAVVGFVVLNQVLGRSGDSTNQGVDTSEVQLLDVEVTLESAQVPGLIDDLAGRNPAFVEFSQPLTTVSLPGGGTTVVGVEVIPAATSNEMATYLNQQLTDAAINVGLTATVVVRAERSGNTSGQIGIIESRAYTHPITVCRGCLVKPECYGSIDYAYGSDGECGRSQNEDYTPASCQIE